MCRLWKFLPLLLMALAAPAPALAECCPKCIAICEDGYDCSTWWPPSWYCGVGSCNIWGCDCEDGCRRAKDLAQCNRYCDEYSTQADAMCTNGCPPEALDECSIQCSETWADRRNSCKRDCTRRFPVAGNAAEGPRDPLEGLVRFGLTDADRNGRIDKRELGRFLRSIKVCGAQPGAEQLEALFAKADKNKSGDITLDEVDADAFAHAQQNQVTIRLSKRMDTAYVEKVVSAAGAGSKAPN